MEPSSRTHTTNRTFGTLGKYVITIIFLVITSIVYNINSGITATLPVEFTLPTVESSTLVAAFETAVAKSSTSIDKIPADENLVLDDPVLAEYLDLSNAVLFDPVVLESRCNTTDKRNRLIDFTMLNNELSTLEIRLNYLWNVVDVFYIMETTVRFRPGAPPKPLHLTENWARFKKFHSKIVLVVLPPEASLPGAKTSFGIENLQRVVSWSLLKERVNPSPNDLIIIADLDEIPRPNVLENLACSVDLPKTPICLQTKDSFYYYNYLCHINLEWTKRPKIVHFSEGLAYLPNCATKIGNAATHCSSCFPTIEDYEEKANANSLMSNEVPLTDRDLMLKTVRECKDFWQRKNLDPTMQLRETVDPGKIPLIVSKHPERWPHLFGKGPLYEDTMSS
jgi:hypothetical protein